MEDVQASPTVFIGKLAVAWTITVGAWVLVERVNRVAPVGLVLTLVVVPAEFFNVICPEDAWGLLVCHQFTSADCDKPGVREKIRMAAFLRFMVVAFL